LFISGSARFFPGLHILVYHQTLHSYVAPVQMDRSAALESPSGSTILEFVMSQVCGVCGKGPQFGNNVSHANNKTRRRWNVNLHPVKAKVAGTTNTKKIRVCSGCLRGGKVTKG
jgi:large subunit ribosomal protein L28